MSTASISRGVFLGWRYFAGRWRLRQIAAADPQLYEIFRKLDRDKKKRLL